MTRQRFLCCLWLIAALAGPVGRADAQSDPSPWRFGVTLGGGAFVGVVAEYWSDDIGVEAKLGTFAFRDVSVRLAPKWRVGTWDGGEASWRLGVQWWSGGPGEGTLLATFHGVELAKVTDGGHVIGGSYNLPLFGGLWGAGDPDEDPEEGTEDPEGETGNPVTVSSWTIGAVLGVTSTFVLGEFTYRYQSQPGG